MYSATTSANLMSALPLDSSTGPTFALQSLGEQVPGDPPRVCSHASQQPLSAAEIGYARSSTSFQVRTLPSQTRQSALGCFLAVSWNARKSEFRSRRLFILTLSVALTKAPAIFRSLPVSPASALGGGAREGRGARTDLELGVEVAHQTHGGEGLCGSFGWRSFVVSFSSIIPRREYGTYLRSWSSVAAAGGGGEEGSSSGPRRDGQLSKVASGTQVAGR